MAYRAEIEIGVKGARQLRDVTEQVQTLAERVDLISANFKPFIQTIQQFDSNLNRTSATLKRVRAGTDDEVTAIRQYVQALGQANTARARQNGLIQQEIALQEAAKRKIQPGPTGFSRAQFGPALPPAFIKQQGDQQTFKKLFADLNETAKVISVSNTNTRTSWQTTFDQLNETAKAISVSRLNTQTSWKTTFDQLNETAKAISVSRLNTQTSWQETFKQLNETAKAIAVSRLNTQTSWKTTFDQLNETAKAISVSRLNTQTSWKTTFDQLNETAKAISVSRLNTQTSWQETFKQLNETAKAISVSRLNTKKAWQDFFKEAAAVAEDLRQSAARVSLRGQERPITVQENISRGRSARIARERSAFLQGSSGSVQLGPSGRAPGTSGFPVAVPLSRAEQKAVDLQNRKLQILNRIKRTRQDLVGLAANLQRLDNNAVVAIADANRQQKELNKNKQKSLEISKAIAKSSPVGGREDIPGSPAFLRARSKRRREAASNALIGGAFPLLFGQGVGASVGGAVGGGLGGLAGGQFGFGASLVGTGVGQAFDTLVASVQNLGKALDEISGDFSAVAAAAGESNTEFSRALQAYENETSQKRALEAATKRLALVVGEEGVDALKVFGEQSTKFGNQTAKAFALIQSSVASLIVSTGLLKAATDAVEKGVLFQQARRNTSGDEQIQKLLEQRDTAAFTDVGKAKELEEQIIQRQKELNLLKEKKQLEELISGTVESRLRKEGVTSRILDAQLKIERNNADMKKEIVCQARLQILAEQLIADKIQLRLQAERANTDEKVLQAQLSNRQKQFDADVEKLRRARNKAIEDAANKANKALSSASANSLKSADQEKKAFESANIARLRSILALKEAENQLTAAKFGDEKALREELSNYAKTTKQLEDILNLTFEQKKAQTESARVIQQINLEQINALNTLKAQRDAQEILKKQELDRLEIARKRSVIDFANQSARNVSDAKFSLARVRTEAAFPFGGQEQEAALFNLDQLQEKAQLQRSIFDERISLERDVADAVSRGNEEEKKAAEVRLKIFNRDSEQISQIVFQRMAVEKQQFRQNQLIEKYGFIADEVGTAVSSSIQAIVTGTGTVEEAFSTMFANIGKAFIDMATQMLAQKLFMTVLGVLGGGGGGFSFAGGSASSGLSAANLMGGTGPLNAGLFGRANGGPVSPGSTYLVGERGPELLTMGTQGGFVHSNRSEAMDRYRSGGPRQGAQTVNVNYTVTEINGMRFVTEEEFRAGMDQAARRGAKMGQTQTMSTLKNSRSQRSKIGL